MAATPPTADPAMIAVLLRGLEAASLELRVATGVKIYKANGFQLV